MHAKVQSENGFHSVYFRKTIFHKWKLQSVFGRPEDSFLYIRQFGITKFTVLVM